MNNAHWLLIFGAVALLVLGGLQAQRLRGPNGSFTANFTVLFGLVLITVLASVLVVMAVPEATLTAVFTLFGTVAGYLAGTKVSSTPPPPASQNAGVSGSTATPPASPNPSIAPPQVTSRSEAPEDQRGGAS